MGREPHIIFCLFSGVLLGSPFANPRQNLKSVGSMDAVLAGKGADSEGWRVYLRVEGRESAYRG
jgi:hypothetical protein